MAAAPKVDPNQTAIDRYKALGLTDAANYATKGKFDEAKAQTDLIKNVYKLDPALYTDKKGNINLDAATKKYDFEKQDVTLPASKPQSFTQALGYYSDILSQAQKFGVNNLNTNYQNALKDAAKIVRSFDSKNLSLDAKQTIANITEASDAIDSINEQRKNVEIQQYRSRGLDVDGITKIKLSKKELEAARGRLVTEQDTLRRLESTASRTAPKLNESLSRLGLSDIGVNIGSTVAGVSKLATGLEALRGESQLGLGTGGLAGKLNVDVTDDQILNDINTARRNQYKSLYDIGTSATTDLQSQLDQANKIYADLPSGKSKIEAQKSIDDIKSQLAQAQKDTLQAKGLYENYQPVSGDQATSAISKFRESLRLPEERTLKQIDVIDPTIGATVRALSKQYQTMAETPLGPTTTKQTEDLRNQIEQEALNQLKLGSTLGAEERRQYEQAARSAQSARGNIFGLGPAVQEAANIGAAAEQRKLARYGAATAFLGSGETTGAAAARDIGLRNALDQSRLGAAQGFIASGPTMYNLASQRLGTQQATLNNYLAASQPLQTGQFQGASSAANPYGYVNPNAGFLGAQNAASIYNTLADLQASQYGSQVGAIASKQSGASQFAQIAGGASSLLSPLKFV
jgi:uncharacterized protein YdbL (DUF1318 family)